MPKKILSEIAREIAADRDAGEVVVIVTMRLVDGWRPVGCVGSSINLADHQNDEVLRQGIACLQTCRPSTMFNRE